MGLARVTSVARTLGVSKPAYRVITVGGTNGKGSTVVHLDKLLRVAGVTTGMFTSPHFIRYNERIQVGGVEVSDEELVAAFEQIERARGTTTLTFFEYNLLAALLVFAERAVDVAVLEVGLGGRLDAVNLVDADVAVVCSIGLDHRDYLGDTLDLIGAEKAGIFRAGRPAVLGTDEMPASVYSAIAGLHARAVVAGKDFTWWVDEKPAAGATVAGGDASSAAGGARWSYNGLRLSLRDLPPSALAGSIQYRNAATALAALEALEMPLPIALSERTVGEALRDVRLPGRFESVQVDSVEWILDIAHNEAAAAIFATHVAERAAATLETTGRKGRTFAVVGILGDKDAGAIARLVDPVVDQWVLCSLGGPRGVTAADLAQRMQLPGLKFTLAASVEEGCAVARATAKPGDRVLVFGSFHTVGPAMRWLGLY